MLEAPRSRCVDLLREVLSYQSDYGAFTSQVQCRTLITDENCFVTTLVLLELARVMPHLRDLDPEQELPVIAGIERALDFVEACRDSSVEGSFRFYPDGLRSPRVHYDFLSADIDDTVLAWTALILFGRREHDAALAMLRKAVESRVVDQLQPGDGPWVCPGVCRTWFGTRPGDDPVDVCVNLNVSALYALCGQSRAPLPSAVSEMLCEAIVHHDFASPDIGSLATYYAHPLELVYAIRRALRFGAGKNLKRVLSRLEAFEWAHEDKRTHCSRTRPICGDASGPPFWMAPAVQAARELSELLFKS